MATTEATAAYKVEARVADRVEVVETKAVPTVGDVCSLLGDDVARLTPTIGGRAADRQTPLVPNAVVEFR